MEALRKTIAVTAFTSITAFVSSLVVAHFQHKEQLKQERIKFEYTIVTNVLNTTTDKNEIWKKFQFYNKLGLIDDLNKEVLCASISSSTEPEKEQITGMQSSASFEKVESSTSQIDSYTEAKEFEEKGFSALLNGNTKLAYYNLIKLTMYTQIFIIVMN